MTIPMALLLGGATALIVGSFAGLVLRRYVSRRRPHLLLWGLGLLFFATASAAEAYSAVAWHPLVFRWWYLSGAVLSAAWIGQGTVHLIAGAIGGSTSNGSMRRLPAVLTAVLLVASVVAAVLVFTLPLNAASFTSAEPLSAQYREILPPDAGVRRMTPLFNIYGTVVLVGGALYSARLQRRGQMPSHRTVGNVLIALGALVIASTATLVRFGLADYLSLGELVSGTLMFSGFVIASRSPSSQRPGLVRP